jgi:predicted PurR-regulated permease PerM
LVSATKSERVEVARGSDGRSVLLPRGVIVATAWSWRLLVIGTALYVAFFLVLSRTAPITTPLLLGVLVAALLHPLYRLIRRARIPGVLAALLAVVVFVVVVGGAVYLVAQQIATGVSDLVGQVRLGFDDLLSRVAALPGLDEQRVDASVDRLRDQLGDVGGQLATGALSVTSTLTGLVTGILLALFATIFFLADGPRIWRFLTGVLPREGREPARIAGQQAWQSVGVYVRTIPVVALVDAILIGGGAAVLGIPFALPIAVLTFLAAFVPVVGAVVAGALAVLVALVSNGVTAAVIMLVIILVVQQLEGNVLQPFLLGRALDLHPLVVLLATSIGLLLAGIPGGVLAVPVVAGLTVAVQSIRRGDAAEHRRARQEVAGSTRAQATAGGAADGGQS